MKQYLDLLNAIKEQGNDHPDRTGTGRRSIFGAQVRFDLSNGEFPLVTTRKIFTKAMVRELLWFIKGSTDVKELQDSKVKIWDKWAVTESDIEEFAIKHSNGDESIKDAIILDYNEHKLNSIGPMYGNIWRNAPQDKLHLLWPTIDIADIPKDKFDLYKKQYEEILFMNQSQEQNQSIVDFETYCKRKYQETVDQLNDLIINLKKRPYSARHIVTAWIPSLVPFEELSPQTNVLMERGSLAPCHMQFQCFVSPPKDANSKSRLSLLMYQRSVDYPVGAPYNIAQYSLLLMMLAHVTNMDAYEFIWTTGDTHVYLDQLHLIDEQLNREPLKLPKVWLNPEIKSIFDFTMEDIEIQDYNPHPEIVYPVSV